MSTPSKKQSNVILILSLLLLAFPVYLLLKWVYVFNTMSTHAERVAAFGVHMTPTLIATASAVAAALFGLSGLLLLAGLRSVICGVAALAGLLLTLWFVWTLL